MSRTSGSGLHGQNQVVTAKADALDDSFKFNYLCGLLQRTALEAISELALTSANYREAVAILEK